MPYEFKMTRRVEFADTDMAGIAHFTALFRYMEETEHAFYRSLGFSVHTRETDRILGMPRVAVGCEFRRPLHFEEEVEVHLIVRERTDRAITYDFVFRKNEEGEMCEAARGHMAVVYAALDDSEKRICVVDLPEHIAAKIDVAPTELS